MVKDASGAIVELRRADGTVLYSSSISGPSFAPSTSGRRYSFSASRTDPDARWNGLHRLELRRTGSKWSVTVRVDSPELWDATLEPTITLVIRMGTACFRRLDAACEQKLSGATCR